MFLEHTTRHITDMRDSLSPQRLDFGRAAPGSHPAATASPHRARSRLGRRTERRDDPSKTRSEGPRGELEGWSAHPRQVTPATRLDTHASPFSRVHSRRWRKTEYMKVWFNGGRARHKYEKKKNAAVMMRSARAGCEAG